MTMQYLPAVEMETAENPDSAIIWLHGLGADGNDFAPIVPALKLDGSYQVRFVFPHAPSIPVSINGGFVMPAWYDILEMNIDRKVDIDGLLISASSIVDLVDREIERGIDSTRIILAGFSQGGAVVYQVGLSYPKQLGGLLAMSSYFATAETVSHNDANSRIPIMVHHGVYDPVVPENLGKAALNRLKEFGYEPDYMNYPMEHGVCPQQIEDISNWFNKILTIADH